MLSVGMICEGPTDRVVLEHLLDGASGARVVVTAVQPPHPMRPGVDFGGWQQVLASVRRGDVTGALAFNALVIVQIDTDVCEEPGFDVLRRLDGRELTHEALLAAVRERLTREILAHDATTDLDRVVLAVCVNELECWLLVHLSPRTPKVVGCSSAVNAALRRANRAPLSKREIRSYEAASRGLRSPEAVEALRGKSASLDAFLEELLRKLPAAD